MPRISLVVLLVLQAVFAPQFLRAAEAPNLIANSGFETTGATEAQAKDFRMSGDVSRGYAGIKGKELSSMGAIFYSGADKNSDGKGEGVVETSVRSINTKQGFWFRFRFYGLPEANFSVAGEQDLYIKIQFSSETGKFNHDGLVKPIWKLVQQRRKDLDSNGIQKRQGAAVWQEYAFEFKLPFGAIDALDLSVGFRNANAKSSKESAFFIDDFSLERIAPPKELDQEFAAAGEKPKEVKLKAGSTLVPLGGRWYYERLAGEQETPKVFSTEHSARLYYRAGRLEAPFAGNMSAWLRAGFLDLKGEKVKEDRYLTDNVTVSFTQDHLVVKAKNIPNHPIAVFPGYLGNPNSVQEQARTYRIRLDPKPNPAAKAMTQKNENRALNMGPVGFAINGVVFYNPFDAGMEEAVDIMDRCCGHPSPDYMYHYHKYPICVRSPFADEGQEHSPLIGFAFDGFPIYGPYEKEGLMAKDCKENPLNEFNLHQDESRGWHYHVTPGKFPYLIGGYYGTVEEANIGHHGPPGGGNGPGEGRGPPPDGPPPPGPPGRGPGRGPRPPPPPPQEP